RGLLLDLGRVPADLLAEGVEAGDGLFRLRRVAGCEEVPDVGMSSDQWQDDLRTHPADQDRWMRALHRLRVTRCVLQVVVLARERRLVLGEERLHHLHRLDQTAGSLALAVERDAVRGVLGLEPGGAQAQDQASVAHLIDGRRHLGEHRRVSVGVAGHQHANLHLFRLRREGGEERPALRAGTGLPVDGHEMIERERRVEAELVARLPATQDVVVRRMLGPRLYAEAYPPRAGRSRAHLLDGADAHLEHTRGGHRAHALDEASTRYRHRNHRTLLCDATARMRVRSLADKPVARRNWG